MPTREPLAIVGFDLRKFERPDTAMLPSEQRDAFKRRMQCLEAIAGGLPIERAAKRGRLSVRTAKDDAELAMEQAPDGRLMGYRACLPYRRRSSRQDNSTRRAARDSGPHAMTRTIRSDAELERLVEGYSGGLPTGKRKNRRFDALDKAFLDRVWTLNDGAGYPFGLPDRGRRELLRYLRRLRRRRLDAGAPVEDRPEANVRSLRDLLELRPLERVEFDAHQADVKLRLEVEKPGGGIALLTIRTLTLLTVICSVTRYLLAHLLVLGEYNRLHVLRLFRRTLQPWQPRELIVPGLAYPAGARLGLPADARSCATFFRWLVSSSRITGTIDLPLRRICVAACSRRSLMNSRSLARFISSAMSWADSVSSLRESLKYVSKCFGRHTRRSASQLP